MDERVEQLLTQLADKLGVTVEYLWNVLLQQSQVQIEILQLGQMLVLAIGLPIIFITSILTFVGYKREWEVWGALFAPLILATLTCVTLSIEFHVKLMTLYSNPEFWALEQILQRLGG